MVFLESLTHPSPASFPKALPFCLDFLGLKQCLSLFRLNKAFQTSLQATRSPPLLHRLIDAFFEDKDNKGPPELKAIRAFLQNPDPGCHPLVTGSFLLHALDPRIPYNDIDILLNLPRVGSEVRIQRFPGAIELTSLERAFNENRGLMVVKNKDYQGDQKNGALAYNIVNVKTYFFPGKLKIQMILMNHDPLDFVEGTDFPILRNFWDGKRVFYSNPTSILKRRLEIYASPKPDYEVWLSEDWRLLRIAKYVGKGFKLSKKETDRYRLEEGKRDLETATRFSKPKTTTLRNDDDAGTFGEYCRRVKSRALDIWTTVIWNRRIQPFLEKPIRLNEDPLMDRLMFHIRGNSTENDPETACLEDLSEPVMFNAFRVKNKSVFKQHFLNFSTNIESARQLLLDLEIAIDLNNGKT